MKGRNPTKAEQYHMDKVQQLGCIVCRNEGNLFVPAEIHHVYGKTRKATKKGGFDAHMKVLPLCYEHHRSGIDCERYTSRHPFKARFVSRYGTEEELLKQVDEILQAVT